MDERMGIDDAFWTEIKSQFGAKQTLWLMLCLVVLGKLLCPNSSRELVTVKVDIGDREKSMNTSTEPNTSDCQQHRRWFSFPLRLTDTDRMMALDATTDRWDLPRGWFLLSDGRVGARDNAILVDANVANTISSDGIELRIEPVGEFSWVQFSDGNVRHMFRFERQAAANDRWKQIYSDLAVPETDRASYEVNFDVRFVLGAVTAALGLAVLFVVLGAIVLGLLVFIGAVALIVWGKPRDSLCEAGKNEEIFGQPVGSGAMKAETAPGSMTTVEYDPQDGFCIFVPGKCGKGTHIEYQNIKVGEAKPGFVSMSPQESSTTIGAVKLSSSGLVSFGDVVLAPGEECNQICFGQFLIQKVAWNGTPPAVSFLRLVHDSGRCWILAFCDDTGSRYWLQARIVRT